jgi:plastocyanin
MRRLVLLFVLIYAAHVEAADITGQVTVLKRSGLKPLKNFAYGLVYIKNLPTDVPAEPAVMMQKRKKFIPRLLPVVSGQEVRFINTESLKHNVFSPHPGEPFDLGRYPKGESKSFRFRELGPHKIYCNLHQKMVADVFVVPGGYHAVTDKNGAYSIKAVPAGSYTVSVWHVLGGEDEKEVHVEDADLKLNFTINSRKVVKDTVKHSNKFGKSYRREYTDDEGNY